MIITINGKKIEAKEGQTILEVTKENGIEVPTLCYHSDLEIKGGCRVCVVEIKDCKNPEPACATKVKEGMEITTESPALDKLRKTNLELIFSQHKEECNDCIWNYNCQLLKLAKKYDVEITRFKDRKSDHPVYKFGPALLFDSSKCIDCGNCVEACKNQGVNYLEFQEKDTFRQVVPSKNRECIYCGQCLTHCPAGAFEGTGEFEDIEKPLKEKDKVVVFQIAPSIRTSIGQDFGLQPGESLTEKISAGIKKLGAEKVFDVSVGADFTTTEEAKEMVKKMQGGKCFTLFSSCCPAWVRFVELYFPEFLPHIATARPPHIISGGLIKTYWAKKNKIDPDNIVVVSIMPCIAKKYEITRKEMLIDKMKPVDYVLTTRELSRLFLRNKIDLKKIEPEPLDNPLGMPSGAGVIYGASGGVMESALRNAFSEINEKVDIDFKQVRGQENFKTAVIEAGGKKIKVAVVNGTGRAAKVLEELRDNPKAYNCVEVMACPGGCIGGGGQPMPTDREIRTKRAQGLYDIDAQKKIRVAKDNLIIKKVYKEFLNNNEIIEKICHTKYKQ